MCVCGGGGGGVRACVRDSVCERKRERVCVWGGGACSNALYEETKELTGGGGGGGGREQNSTNIRINSNNQEPRTCLTSPYLAKLLTVCAISPAQKQ